MDNRFKLRDYVEVKKNSCGYKKGDIGKIVGKGHFDNWIVFVPNRNSTSKQKPNVAFNTSSLTPSIEEAYNAQHGITKKYDHEVVHCTTQEQWDFVFNKGNYHEDAKECFSKECFSEKGVYDALSLFEGGWASLEFYKDRYSDLKIYTFQEWCEKFGHVFEEKTKFEEDFIPGEYYFERYSSWDYSYIIKYDSSEYLEVRDDGRHIYKDYRSCNWGNNKSQKRKATEEEKKWLDACIKAGEFVSKEEALGKIQPIDDVKPGSSTDMTKEESLEELLEEARRRYPIGTKFKKNEEAYRTTECSLDLVYTVEEELQIEGTGISHKGIPFVYFSGHWAEIVEEPSGKKQSDLYHVNMPDYEFQMATNKIAMLSQEQFVGDSQSRDELPYLKIYVPKNLRND